MKYKRMIPKLLYYGIAIFAILFGLSLLYRGVFTTEWHDFYVFYNSARAALNGTTIYIITGKYNLPFWYFPWAAWIYIPFAIWSKEIALVLYKCVTFACAIWVTLYLLRYYNPTLPLLDKLLVFAFMIPMTLQLMVTGQMDYILLAVILIIMLAIEQKRDLLVALLLPIIWIKPHLMIVLTLMIFLKTGKRTILVSLLFCGMMLLIETIISPNWLGEMLGLLKDGTVRTKSLGFTTLPSLFGFQENWVGTANLPFSILLICITIFIVWRFRSMPTIPLLSFALAASLFCAPRAHAYDLTLLVPVLIWMTAKNFRSTVWVWLLAGAIPVLTGYSAIAYLLTLIIFPLSVWHAHKEKALINAQIVPNAV